MNQLELAVRRLIYAHFGRTGEALTRAELAAQLDKPAAWIDEVLSALATHRAVVLGEDGEIAKALPFCASATPFIVRASSVNYYGNCAWDAFGLAAMLGPSAEIDLRCGYSNEPIELDDQARVHLSVPAAAWWEDIFFT